MAQIRSKVEQAGEAAQYALRLGDDALILGQRLCEWSGQAPTLEEDLAIANVALDYLGRARMLYDYVNQAAGCSEDELAFFRDVADMRNLLLMELPRGDFAFTLARQFLVDVFDVLFFAVLLKSADATLAAIAAKTSKEVQYHARRSEQWMKRLGLGTDVSRERLQAGVEEAWGYVDELFEMDDLEMSLARQGIAPDRRELRDSWQVRVSEVLQAAEIEVPDSSWQVNGGRNGVHTEHLGHLLSDMQFMQRAYPGLSW